MHWIIYAAKDETEAEQVAELLEAVANGRVSLEKLEILVSKLQIMAPTNIPLNGQNQNGINIMLHCLQTLIL